MRVNHCAPASTVVERSLLLSKITQLRVLLGKTGLSNRSLLISNHHAPAGLDSEHAYPYDNSVEQKNVRHLICWIWPNYTTLGLPQLLGTITLGLPQLLRFSSFPELEHQVYCNNLEFAQNPVDIRSDDLSFWVEQLLPYIPDNELQITDGQLVKAFIWLQNPVSHALANALHCNFKDLCKQTHLLPTDTFYIGAFNGMVKW